MRKLRITALSAMLLMAGLAAQAQSIRQGTAKTSAGKEVTFNYTELKPGETGTMTVTLPQETVNAMAKGEVVEIKFPSQRGISYSTIKLVDGMQMPGGSVVLTGSAPAKFTIEARSDGEGHETGLFIEKR